MKKIINKKEDLVDEMISGYVKSHCDRVKISKSSNRIIVRNEKKDNSKVALLIGNGSGHEPIAIGWIGKGLLDANVVGDIFSAPSGDLIFEGIKEFKKNSSIILLISHHAGDLMNGEMAIELAQEEKLDAIPLIMYDDIASAPKGNESERRGAAGTTFIYKILGAASENGIQKDELISLGKTVRDATRTLSVGIEGGISPINGKPIFTLEKDEIFIGMGVHGESGYGRQKLTSSFKIVEFITDRILEDYEINSGDIVIPFVNGSGKTTLMELLIIFNDLENYLSNKGIKVFKPLINEYITTQDTAGFSISLLKSNEEMRKLWCYPVSAPYFHL